MRKLQFFYALLFVAAFVACKDEDEDPTFKKSDFIGRWEETASNPPDEEEGMSCDTYKQEIEISETEIEFISTCNGVPGSATVAYTFDNKRTVTTSVLGIEVKSVIVELTSTTLKIDNYTNGTKYETVTYKKV